MHREVPDAAGRTLGALGLGIPKWADFWLSGSLKKQQVRGKRSAHRSEK